MNAMRGEITMSPDTAAFLISQINRTNTIEGLASLEAQLATYENNGFVQECKKTLENRLNTLVHGNLTELVQTMKDFPKYLGYHDDDLLPVKAGDQIVIPAGVEVKSMHPSKKLYRTKRAQTVRIDHVLNGIVRPAYHKDQFTGITNPAVRWAGSGGYWCEVDINDVLDENGCPKKVS